MADKEKTNYKDLVAEAESAVAAVKDPELRRAAFEKVLENLLRRPQRDREHKPGKERTSSTAESTGKKRSRRGPRGYIEELIGDGFFSHRKTIAEVKAELGNRGHHLPVTGLSGPLQQLCISKELRRQKQKADGKNKTVYAYSRW